MKRGNQHALKIEFTEMIGEKLKVVGFCAATVSMMREADNAFNYK